MHFFQVHKQLLLPDGFGLFIKIKWINNNQTIFILTYFFHYLKNKNQNRLFQL